MERCHWNVCPNIYFIVSETLRTFLFKAMLYFLTDIWLV